MAGWLDGPIKQLWHQWEPPPQTSPALLGHPWLQCGMMRVPAVIVVQPEVFLRLPSSAQRPPQTLRLHLPLNSEECRERFWESQTRVRGDVGDGSWRDMCPTGWGALWALKMLSLPRAAVGDVGPGSPMQVTG